MKEITTANDRLILGYESCRECTWRHVFWVDEGVPQSQMLVSLSTPGLYVCPVCRVDRSGRLFMCGMMPYSALFDDDCPQSVLEKDINVEANDGPMTLRQHLRAAIEWLSPVEQETREHLMVVVGFMLLFLVLAAGLRDGMMAATVVGLLGLGLKIYLGWHLIVMLLVTVLTPRAARQIAWRANGDKPLFPGFKYFWQCQKNRRMNAAFLRSEGFDRRAARRSASKC